MGKVNIDLFFKGLIFFIDTAFHFFSNFFHKITEKNKDGPLLILIRQKQTKALTLTIFFILFLIRLYNENELPLKTNKKLIR